MAKTTEEILLYGSIDVNSSSQFIEDVNEALEENPDTDIVVRVNTPGGSPEYGWGIIAKFAELTNKKLVKNDGKAHSMGLFFNCYAKDCEALEVTEFLLHRAAYPDWIENNADIFDDAMRGNLERVNTSLRKAFEAKVDVKKFEELKGVKVKDIFSMDSRLEVFLTAQDAKKIGLINKITKITPEKQAELNAFEKLAAGYKFEIAATTEEKNPSKYTTMTLAELKEKDPVAYAAAIAAGVEQGIKEERERVNAIMAFMEIDKESCTKFIKDGKTLSQADFAEFTVKAINASKLETIKKDSEGKEIVTEEVAKEKTEKEKTVEAFEAEVAAIRKSEKK